MKQLHIVVLKFKIELKYYRNILTCGHFDSRISLLNKAIE